MDWNKLKREYVKGGISYKQLSEKYGVSLSALKRLGAKEGWGELRSQTVAKTSQKLVDSLSSKNAEVGTRMFAVVNRLLDKVEKAVEELDITMVTNTRKEKTIEYNNTLRPDKPTKEIVEETEQLMETRTIVDRSGLKAIASALRDIKEIQMLRSDLDVQEQEARIARLQKDAQKEDDTVSEVVVTIGEGMRMAKLSISIPEPNEKQKIFLADTHRHVAYGGARGGGKSWAVRVKAILLCMGNPGIKVLIVRRTYPELINNHIIPLQQMLPLGVARYNDSKKVFSFCNKSSIWFGYCTSDNDLNRYQGAEYDVIFFDEATQLKEDWIKKINLAVRQPNGLPKRTYYTCNPGGVSHNYIKRLFIERRYEEKEIPEHYSFTQALVTDNAVMMASNPDYIAELEALPPKLREAWLHGSWDIFEGQFFEDFMDMPEHYTDRQWSHVIDPFEIPDSWTIYRGFDWGYNRPFACGWFAVNPDGVIYHILELYGCTKTPNEGVKWVPPKVFAEIHRIETEHRWLRGKKIIGIADPAIWDAETGESIADVAGRHQVYFSPGDHKRIPGWMQMHYRFAFDKSGFPMFYVFKNCKNFIRTIPMLQYDEHKPEDLDTDGEDHIADMVRYVLMARPIKPRQAAKKDPYMDSPMHLFLDIPKEDIKARAVMPRMEIID